jgi:DNA-binding MarR family transcriptional regulator
VVSLADRGKNLVETLTPKALDYEAAILEGLPAKGIKTTCKTLRLMYQHIIQLRR